MRDVKTGLESQKELAVGVNKLANIVRETLGPKGRFIAIDKGPNAQPLVTKDGVSVADEVILPVPNENTGAQMVKQAAKKAAGLAGDGTTTATVLAQSMVNVGIKNITAGANPIDITRGINHAVEIIVKSLKKVSEPVKSLRTMTEIATVSSNNDHELGSCIAKALHKVGKDGVVKPIPASGRDTSVEIEDGMRIPDGWESRFFVTNDKSQTVEFTDPNILIYEGSISSIKDLIPVLKEASSDNKGFVIIADKVDGEAMATLIANKVQGGLKVVTIKSPALGDIRKDILEDIAAYTGATIFSDGRGRPLREARLSDCGTCEAITVSKTESVMIGAVKGVSMEERIAKLRVRISEETNSANKQVLADRLARLSDGVAILHIGASSDVELKEKMDRVDDALSATRAAMYEGVVAGGGVALLRASKELDSVSFADNQDKTLGVNIVKEALHSPIRQILINAGLSPDVIVQNVLDGSKGYGFNANTEEYEDLIKSGVIDPVKVTRVALESAASVATMVLMVGGTIATDLSQE